MGVLDEIKRQANASGVRIQSSQEAKLEKMLNALFFKEPVPELEGAFVEHVMTRGTGDTERKGLHASNLLAGPDAFCLRAMVLEMHYHQQQGEDLPVNVRRIFEEGNSVHEKWQRLFLRGGWSAVDDLDSTRLYEPLNLSYSPDAIVSVPELFDGEPMVCEIKSVNTYTYDKMDRHPSAWRQCMFYMRLGGYKHGFVLSENKNNQQFFVEVYEGYDVGRMAPYTDRIADIVRANERLERDHKLVRRPDGATAPECKLCENCVVRDICWKRERPRKL